MIMKRLLFFVSISIAILSCKKEPESLILNLDSQEIVFYSKSESQELLITTNSTWSAEVGENADWCTISTRNGTPADKIVVVTVSANESGKERETTIKITSGDIVKEVSVKQKINTGLVFDRQYILSSPEGLTEVVGLNNKKKFNIIVPDNFSNWIKTTLENTSLVVKVETNNSDQERSGYIIARINNTDLYDTLRIIQVTSSEGKDESIDAYPGQVGEIVEVDINGDKYTCEYLNNEYIFEGDIVIDLNSEVNTKAAFIKSYNRWPYGKIYFSINAANDRNNILEAIDKAEEGTNLKFIEISIPEAKEYYKDRIAFVYGNGFSSRVGKVGGIQNIKLTTNGSSGTILHEIGHAIGLVHEHSRQDRDIYLFVDTANIIKNKRHNFIKKSTISSGAFDFQSLMLYGPFFFAINKKYPTIYLRRPDSNGSFVYKVNSSNFSPIDKIEINNQYPFQSYIPPDVITYRLLTQNIESSRAIVVGKVLFDNDQPIQERGFMWTDYNTIPSIGYADHHRIIDPRLTQSSGRVDYYCLMDKLQPKKQYWVRAYVIQNYQVIYGNIVTFQTKEEQVPTVVTNNPLDTDISNTSVKLSATITNVGDPIYTETGFCWSTIPSPTIQDNKQIVSEINGNTFSYTITGLAEGTKYYVRSYISNDKVGSYGNIVSFTTGILPVAAFTGTPANITAGQIVQFTDQSTNIPKSWIWNFGDGGTSTAQNPSHTYTSAGTYTVSLKVSNNYGSNTLTRTNYITVADVPVGAVSDVDGNVYNTVTIGTQVWMKENLKTTKFRNGDLIGTTTPATLEINTPIFPTPIYQWAYEGNESNVTAYGRLYTWYAATDSRGLCPTGWHLPSDAEWTTLFTFLGGEQIAGDKLRERGTTHWESSNDNVTNSSGFTALPGGSRQDTGRFYAIGLIAEWWSSEGNNTIWAESIFISYGLSHAGRAYPAKSFGLSIRCLRDY